MSENERVVENATCTFCGCVCDDQILTVNDAEKRITKVKNTCALGRAWFTEHTIEDRPMALIDGEEATTEAAGEAAAEKNTQRAGAEAPASTRSLASCRARRGTQIGNASTKDRLTARCRRQAVEIVQRQGRGERPDRQAGHLRQPARGR